MAEDVHGGSSLASPRSPSIARVDDNFIFSFTHKDRPFSGASGNLEVVELVDSSEESGFDHEPDGLPLIVYIGYQPIQYQSEYGSGSTANKIDRYMSGRGNHLFKIKDFGHVKKWWPNSADEYLDLKQKFPLVIMQPQTSILLYFAHSQFLAYNSMAYKFDRYSSGCRSNLYEIEVVGHLK